MHRPGIASVSYDTVILDGTTMEELERYHVETLRHVLDKVNADVAEHDHKERTRAQREAEAAQLSFVPPGRGQGGRSQSLSHARGLRRVFAIPPRNGSTRPDRDFENR
jgi:sRNA-binding protein